MGIPDYLQTMNRCYKKIADTLNEMGVEIKAVEIPKETTKWQKFKKFIIRILRP